MRRIQMRMKIQRCKHLVIKTDKKEIMEDFHMLNISLEDFQYKQGVLDAWFPFVNEVHKAQHLY